MYCQKMLVLYENSHLLNWNKINDIFLVNLKMEKLKQRKLFLLQMDF